MTANAPWRSPATVGWCQLLLDSYAHWFGEQLVVRGGSPEDEAEELFGAPFLVASHRFADDPVFNFGNQVALDVLELEWDVLTRYPSRRTTEPDLRPERAQMLAATKAQGFFRGYSGVRVSSRGRRMQIEDATLWNVLGPDGEALGQAVTSPRCTPLPTPLPDPPARPVNVASRPPSRFLERRGASSAASQPPQSPAHFPGRQRGCSALSEAPRDQRRLLIGGRAAGGAGEPRRRPSCFHTAGLPYRSPGG